MKYIVLILIALSLMSCADTVTFEQAATLPQVGFWYGLWHGIIAPIALVVGWFTDISIYAIYNNGGWYDFGFLLGVGAFVSSSKIKGN